ncbi:MAG: COG4315 family predicted lipoprotein [Ktedonobacterales bacterium]
MSVIGTGTRTWTRLAALTLVTGAALALLAGCGSAGTGGGAGYGGGGTSNTPVVGGSGATATGASVKISTKSVTVKGVATTVLADANGKTLYYFTPDTATQSACTGGCAKAWPALLVPSGASLGQSSLAGALSMVSTANGAQVEYNGHLLYTFASDQSASDAKGEGILGKWFVATPDLAAASASGGGSTGGSPAPTATAAYNY